MSYFIFYCFSSCGCLNCSSICNFIKIRGTSGDQAAISPQIQYSNFGTPAMDLEATRHLLQTQASNTTLLLKMQAARAKVSLPAQQDQHKAVQCQQFLRGKCKRGEKCRFAHGPKPSDQKPLCKTCKNGPASSKCKFTLCGNCCQCGAHGAKKKLGKKAAEDAEAAEPEPPRKKGSGCFNGGTRAFSASESSEGDDVEDSRHRRHRY